MTALIYVVIIVALVTYFIMFNINSLAQGFGQVYNNKKKYVVRAMKRDRNEAWKQRGQRFEVFRPKHEVRTFRRRKRRTKEDDVNDQPWVIE